MKKSIYIGIFALLIGTLWSCSEADLDPTLGQDKDVDSSINTDGDLFAVLNGMYNRVSGSTYYGRNVIIYGEVRSDNTYSNANSNRFVVPAEMNMTIESGDASDTWSQLYRVIGSANIVISSEGLEGDQSVISHYKGEAYAMRALAHFDLLRIFGQQHVNGGGLSSLGVPYVTSFRDPEELFPARNTVQEVRDMAYADLDMAITLMDSSLDNPSKENLTSDAARAIKARIALYFGDWSIALNMANAVINSGDFSIASASEFKGTFGVDAASNSIFEIAASPTDNAGINGLANIYQDTNYGDVVALPELAAIYEEGDVRGVLYDAMGEPTMDGIITIDAQGSFRNTGKYPTLGSFEDNIPVIRIEEMYLIKAEALLETGDAAGALVELNKIPSNRDASEYTSATKDNILTERRKELAFEGFRFDDLARTGRDIPLVNGVLQTHGGPEYGSYNYAFPIPANEVQSNSNMEQNFGY